MVYFTHTTEFGIATRARCSSVSVIFQDPIDETLDQLSRSLLVVDIEEAFAPDAEDVNTIEWFSFHDSDPCV